MTSKPLTKALHTVRVVEAIARHLTGTREYATARTLLSDVLDILGNAAPTDKALADKCLSICGAVMVTETKVQS